MYKLFVVAAILAVAAGEGFYPAGYAGLGGLYPAGLGGLYGGYAGGYAGLHGLPYAAPAYAPYAAAPLAAAAPAPVVAAPVPARYAVPAARVIAEEPIVEQIVEPVEQWGYKIKY